MSDSHFKMRSTNWSDVCAAKSGCKAASRRANVLFRVLGMNLAHSLLQASKPLCSVTARISLSAAPPVNIAKIQYRDVCNFISSSSPDKGMALTDAAALSKIRVYFGSKSAL